MRNVRWWLILGFAGALGLTSTALAQTFSPRNLSGVWIGKRDGLLRFAEGALTREPVTRDTVQALAVEKDDGPLRRRQARAVGVVQALLDDPDQFGRPATHFGVVPTR